MTLMKAKISSFSIASTAALVLLAGMLAPVSPAIAAEEEAGAAPIQAVQNPGESSEAVETPGNTPDALSSAGTDVRGISGTLNFPAEVPAGIRNSLTFGLTPVSGSFVECWKGGSLTSLDPVTGAFTLADLPACNYKLDFYYAATNTTATFSAAETLDIDLTQGDSTGLTIDMQVHGAASSELTFTASQYDFPGKLFLIDTSGVKIDVTTHKGGWGHGGNDGLMQGYMLQAGAGDYSLRVELNNGITLYYSSTKPNGLTTKPSEATRIPINNFEVTQLMPIKTAPWQVLSGASPKISSKASTARVGETVKVTTGAWTTGTSLSYQWVRNGKNITGATKNTYKAVSADAGKKLTVKVTGKKPGFTNLTKTSAAKSVDLQKLVAATPKVSNKISNAKVGKTVKVSVGKWTSGTKLSYQWLRNEKAVKGATKPSYKITKSDKGKKLSVKVTGKKSGYATAAKTSNKTATIK